MILKISIICVGKLKEKYWQMAITEYLKRLSRYANVEIIEVADEKAPENMSDAQEQIVKDKEGERILKNIKDDMYVISLAIAGQRYSSEGFADFINNQMINSVSSIAFIIGGSLGISQNVMKRADISISFSKMTFPHQMMRVILLEQIYRGFRIIKNEPYHK